MSDMRYRGFNGEIETDGRTLAITRSGLVARGAFGKNVEPRVIPLRAIRGVRLKPATRLMNGWLQLLLGGGDTPELSTGTAPSNGDTVMFTHKNREAFGQLHRWLESVAAENTAHEVDPSAFPVTGEAVKPAVLTLSRRRRLQQLTGRLQQLTGREGSNKKRLLRTPGTRTSRWLEHGQVARRIARSLGTPMRMRSCGCSSAAEQRECWPLSMTVC